jgi:hypothetical protein
VICLSQRLSRACLSTCRIRRNREWLISVLRTLPCAHSKASELTLWVALRWRLIAFGWLWITHRCFEQLWLWVCDPYSGTVRCSLRLTDSLWCAIRCAIALKLYLRTDLQCSLPRKDSSGERVHTLAVEIPSMVIGYSLGSDKRLLEKVPLDPASSYMLVSPLFCCFRVKARVFRCHSHWYIRVVNSFVQLLWRHHLDGCFHYFSLCGHIVSGEMSEIRPSWERLVWPTDD